MTRIARPQLPTHTCALGAATAATSMTGTSALAQGAEFKM